MSDEALTDREYAVLRAYASGASQKAVAESLGISLQTFKNHLTNIYRKLDARSCVDAFRIVGWLNPDA